MRKHYSLTFTAVSCLVLRYASPVSPSMAVSWWIVSLLTALVSLPPHLLIFNTNPAASPSKIQDKQQELDFHPCFHRLSYFHVFLSLASSVENSLVLCCQEEETFASSKTSSSQQQQRMACLVVKERQEILTTGITFQEKRRGSEQLESQTLPVEEESKMMSRWERNSCCRKSSSWREGENRQMCSKRQGMMWVPRMTFSLGKLLSFEAKRETVIRQDHLSSN